ncbi:MAG: type IV pilus biogenesis/stability protein PilW [Gammaproteobacteria bacterium]|nr:MAG: type IV pilus biogenesis/stability protein PilW [Gammaproteobacteria bacterium]
MKIKTTSVVLCSLILLVGCKTGGTRSGEDGYSPKQSPETYINTPAYINVQLGIGYMREGDFNLALARLKKALTQNPDLAIGHGTIAVLYEELGEFELSEKHYRKAIRLDYNNSSLHNNYGQYLCKHSDPRKAIEQFEIAAGNPLYKNTQIPLTNAGACALRIPDPALAEEYLRRALEYNPRFPPALASMIQISADNEKYLQGRAYLQRYREVAKHTADTLWNGYKIEKNLGDRDAAGNYAVRLKSRFPDSVQTKLLLDEIAER